MILPTLVLSVFALVQSSDSGVAVASQPICEVSGQIRHTPLVSSADAAKAIFLAVEPALIRADVERFPTVVAGDLGDKWIVGRATRPDLDIRGGGQLELKISKCDAAISDITYDQ